MAAEVAHPASGAPSANSAITGTTSSPQPGNRGKSRKGVSGERNSSQTHSQSNLIAAVAEVDTATPANRPEQQTHVVFSDDTGLVGAVTDNAIPVADRQATVNLLA